MVGEQFETTKESVFPTMSTKRRGVMLMYKVDFYNFGYSKHFDTLEQAIENAKSSGFQCAVWFDNALIRNF